MASRPLTGREVYLYQWDMRVIPPARVLTESGVPIDNIWFRSQSLLLGGRTAAFDLLHRRHTNPLRAVRGAGHLSRTDVSKRRRNSTSHLDALPFELSELGFMARERVGGGLGVPRIGRPGVE